LQSEVRCAITELNNGKTPGEDGAWNEHIKQGEELLVQPIPYCLIELYKQKSFQKSVKPIPSFYYTRKEPKMT
jgi:hypothetical protein